MATVNLTNFYDLVMPHLPGCPETIALQQIRLAAIEFCRKTECWQYTHPIISSVANTATYAFSPPSGAVVSRILPGQVWYNDYEIFAKSTGELSRIYNNWMKEVGTPYFYTGLDELGITLVPYPSVSLASALRMRVSLKPTKDATTLDAQVYAEYHEEISRGAIGRLQLVQKKPYSDLQMGAAHMVEFRADIQRVKTRAMGFVQPTVAAADEFA